MPTDWGREGPDGAMHVHASCNGALTWEGDPLRMVWALQLAREQRREQGAGDVEEQ